MGSEYLRIASGEVGFGEPEAVPLWKGGGRLVSHLQLLAISTQDFSFRWLESGDL